MKLEAEKRAERLMEEAKEEFLEKEPQASPFFRHYMMGKDFIDRQPRYCIWLVGADPGLLKKCPMILERVNKVRRSLWFFFQKLFLFLFRQY